MFYTVLSNYSFAVSQSSATTNLGMKSYAEVFVEYGMNVGSKSAILLGILGFDHCFTWTAFTCKDQIEYFFSLPTSHSYRCSALSVKQSHYHRPEGHKFPTALEISLL